jgi:hypothetical protein
MQIFLRELQLEYAQVPISKGEAHSPCEAVFPYCNDPWYAHASHGRLRGWVVKFDSFEKEIEH